MSERDPFDMVGTDTSVQDVVRQSRKRINALARRNVRANNLEQLAPDGGAMGPIDFGAMSVDTERVYTNANQVDVNWWLPLNLADDDVTYVFAMVYDGSEFVYVGGSFTRIGGVAAANIARYSLITRNWESIGGQLNNVVYALAISGTNLYVGGAFTNADGIATADFIAKYDTSGGTWASIGGQLSNVVSALALSGTDLYVGGDFVNADGIATADRIAKYDTSGGTWASIGGQLNSGVYALVISGTDLYVGGAFTDADGIATADFIAKYDTSGGTWASIGGQLNFTVFALAISGTDLYVGGAFTDAGGIATADFIAKYDTSGGTWASIGGQLNNAVRALALSGTDLYVGGIFTNADGIATADRLAKYDTASGVWSTVSNGEGASGLDGYIYSILALDSGSVIAGGSFNYVGAINCQSIAILCKPLNEAIDVIASLFELYAERTSITHDSATIDDLTATDATITNLILTTLNNRNFWKIVYKAADQSKTADTALASDTDLSFAVTSGKKYAIRGRVFFDTAATPDFKYRLGGGATITPLRIFTKHVVPGATAFTNAIETAFPTTTQAVTGAGSTGGYIEIDGQFEVTATGTIALQWAQNSSSASATKVLAGSYLELLEVG